MLQRTRPAACVLALAALLSLSPDTDAQRRRVKIRRPSSPPAAAPAINPTAPQMWVSGFSSNAVHRFDTSTGAALGSQAPIPGAQSIRRGPDRLWYVCAEKTDEILRIYPDGSQERFVWDDPGTPEDDNGPLNGPTAAVFGPDGNLYVASFDNDRVLRYDGSTGQFMDTFVTAGCGGLDGPDAGMVFGPDGRLYVPSFNTNRVMRYNGETGAFLKVWAKVGTGLRQPRMIRFLANGTALVSSWGSAEIIHYSASGTKLGIVADLVNPTGFAIHPTNGDLYVTSDQSDKVVRFVGLTGVRVGAVVTPGTGGLDGATFVEFLVR